MTRVTEFYSVLEAKKPPPNRVYHTTERLSLRKTYSSS